MFNLYCLSWFSCTAQHLAVLDTSIYTASVGSAVQLNTWQCWILQSILPQLVQLYSSTPGSVGYFNLYCLSWFSCTAQHLAVLDTSIYTASVGSAVQLNTWQCWILQSILPQLVQLYSSTPGSVGYFNLYCLSWFSCIAQHLAVLDTSIYTASVGSAVQLNTWQCWILQSILPQLVQLYSSTPGSVGYSDYWYARQRGHQ